MTYDSKQPMTPEARFERFPTVDVALGWHCPCWRHVGGPFVEHPAGCLCPCHGGRREA